MTTVGHSLMGASIGVLCLPRMWRPTAVAAGLVAFAALANAPDIALWLTRPGTYDICHSIFVNAALMALPIALPACLPGWRRAVGGWPVVVGGAAAWWSHLLLDSTYNHGRGVALVWPINNTTSLPLPIPWFQTLKPWRHFAAVNCRTFAIELLCYGGLLAVCVLIRRRRGRSRKCWVVGT
jgi:membrane-bound metal-dependent hydrolase YbcI (DUF457 family)